MKDFVFRKPFFFANVSPAQLAALRKFATMPKILIVEDQDETRKMLRMALNKHAELILEAADGASALQVAEEQKPRRHPV